MARQRAMVLATVCGCMVAVMLATQFPAWAQGDPAERALQGFADEVIELIRKNDIPRAVDLLAVRGHWSDTIAKQNLAKLSEDRGKILGHLGKSLGEIDLLPTEKVGTSFARFKFLERYENHAILWRMSLYRSGDEWRLQDFTWTSDLTAEYAVAPL